MQPYYFMSKAYIPFKLDKMRNLRYGMKAFCLVEETLGKPLAELDMNKLTIKQLATLIWAGLVHEDSTLSVDIVMDLIDEHSSLQEAAKQLTKAIQESQGKNDLGAAVKK